jgi:predicted amidophosphoribosyltransferase
VHDLVTTVYPSDCRACGGPLLEADLSPVCDQCIDSVTPQSMTLCRCCGEALDMEGVRFAGQFPVEGLLCSPCRMVPPEFERATAYAVYEDELREMIHLLKKRSRPEWKLQAAHGVIRRVKDTRSQFELTPKGRRRNLQGAFAVADGATLRGREVLLVDDIYTTGATARACSQALRQAGASKVWVATVSRAQPEMVASWDSLMQVAAWSAG